MGPYLSDTSICRECVFCTYLPEEEDVPGMHICSEGMDNFGTDEGCWCFDRVVEIDEPEQSD